MAGGQREELSGSGAVRNEDAHDVFPGRVTLHARGPQGFEEHGQLPLRSQLDHPAGWSFQLTERSLRDDGRPVHDHQVVANVLHVRQQVR